MNETSDLDETSATKPTRGKWSRFLRRLLRLGLLTMFLLCLVGWFVYSSAQKEPEFYQAALSVDMQVQDREGDEFEKRLLDLQNNARTDQQWQATFSESQINGWLVADFPEKFPNVMPLSIKDPRVGLGLDKLNVAFRFTSTNIKGIVQVEADAFCTDVPGQIAIRIKTVKTGILPIPISSFADRITRSIRRAGLDVEWSEIERDPVALINLGNDGIKLGEKKVEIESIQLLEKKIVVTGKSIEAE